MTLVEEARMIADKAEANGSMIAAVSLRLCADEIDRLTAKLREAAAELQRLKSDTVGEVVRAAEKLGCWNYHQVLRVDRTGRGFTGRALSFAHDLDALKDALARHKEPVL